MAAKKEDIFLDDKRSEKSESNVRNSPIPYLKRGDSTVYIGQFLAKEEEPSPAKPIFNPPVVNEDPKEEHSEMESVSQVSARTKMNPSAFHNFQKHLTVALKHAIVLPNEDKLHRDYLKAATKLWKIFSSSKVCTKKVLHFLLGDKNEHQTTAEDLREFGFSKLYEHYGEKVIRDARVFLLQETLRQIQEGVLESYFEHKKLKDKDKFQRYVKIFVEELQEGYLRKRLPREKVAELMG